MDDLSLECLKRARDELLRVIERGQVPTWLVDAVSTTFAEVTARLASRMFPEQDGATLARAETLLELLRSYRTSPSIVR